jgi:hypothetical protein
MHFMSNKVTELSAFGSPFSHDITSCHNISPKNFKWVFNKQSKNNVEVYLDYDILGGFKSKCKNKFLWICESRGIIPAQMEFIYSNSERLKEVYNKIFVHDYNFLKLGPEFVYCPAAANHTWVVNRGIHKKTKLASMVSSGKNMCEGHRYRNHLMESFKSKFTNIDYYGRAFNPFNVKEDVLNDYYFSITIENEKYSNYYTEKLMDCFATGTIPVYYGTPEVDKMFNTDGIIVLDNTFDINQLSPDLYYSKLDAVKDNFERCMNHQTADDFIYERIVESI